MEREAGRGLSKRLATGGIATPLSELRTVLLGPAGGFLEHQAGPVEERPIVPTEAQAPASLRCRGWNSAMVLTGSTAISSSR